MELDDYLVEGYVSVKDLKGDYEYYEDSYCLSSLDGQQNYYIGDKLKLKVSAASKKAHTINFEVSEKVMENKTRRVDRSAYSAGNIINSFSKQYKKTKRAKRRK